MRSLATRAAIVTGSSRGIGRAVALRLARDGFAVTVNYLRSSETAAQLVDQITEAGGTAIAVQADVAHADDRNRLVDTTINTWQRLDLLVNNAGITSVGRRDLLDLTESSWDQVLATNLKGPFFLAQRAAHEMLRLKATSPSAAPCIVNISSISAYAVSTDRADYCIAKAGMQMMTWLLAARLAQHDVRVFEICPGIIATDMTQPVKEKYDRQIAEGLTPIRRWGQPEDVAEAVALLASGALSFSTGDRINVDGGFHIRRLG